MFKKLSRRSFLKNSSTAVAGVAAVSSGSVIINAEEAWALSTENLDSKTAKTLLVLARHLYTHDFLGDQYYAVVVHNLDEQAGSDSDLKKKLADGANELGKVLEADRVYDIDYVEQSSGLQMQNLKRIEKDHNDFFETVRGATLGGLYGNPRVAEMFGFEGSSVEHGGYIERGFDDIGWLPKK